VEAEALLIWARACWLAFASPLLLGIQQAAATSGQCTYTSTSTSICRSACAIYRSAYQSQGKDGPPVNPPPFARESCHWAVVRTTLPPIIYCVYIVCVISLTRFYKKYVQYLYLQINLLKY
jgi:hypothetical protein